MTTYDEFTVKIYRALIDPLIGPLRSRIVTLCIDLKVTKVLDIASATGVQCRMLADEGIKATGLDLSQAMTVSATRHSKLNVRYVQGSAYALPFEDNEFDASLLVLALHEHTEEERTRMLAEACRVVRPKGHLIIADYNLPRWCGINIPWQVIRFIEAIAGEEHHAGFKEFMAQGGVLGLLRRNGLVPLREIHSHFDTIRVILTGCEA
jgi:demethylmenaquinone methyltransferase/2-methoxy-6-polyprenyl-1,4-benzoquinol methylase